MLVTKKTLKKLLQEEREKSYNEGRAAGHKEGYREGLHEGLTKDKKGLIMNVNGIYKFNNVNTTNLESEKC